MYGARVSVVSGDVVVGILVFNLSRRGCSTRMHVSMVRRGRVVVSWASLRLCGWDIVFFSFVVVLFLLSNMYVCVYVCMDGWMGTWACCCLLCKSETAAWNVSLFFDVFLGSVDRVYFCTNIHM